MMTPHTFTRLTRRLAGAALITAALGAGSTLFAQAPAAPAAPAAGRQGGAAAPAVPAAPPTAKAQAPTDFTGWWVAVITEDWRFRMMTAPKGDFSSVPLNAEGQRVTREWDIAKDIARGEQCKPYGAANIMRMPTRLHITWQDEQTLKIEADNGTQTRLLHFDAKAKAPVVPDWQGFSLAHWEGTYEGQGAAVFTGGQAGAQNLLRPGLTGSLVVETSRMRPGYLRRNGVPYSGNTKMTEYLDRTREANGDSWLTVLTVIEDPTYLVMPFTLSTHFKREADGSKFQPRPCELVPPTATLPAPAR